MGWRYFIYRAGFEIKKRSGWLKRSFPTTEHIVDAPSLEKWKKGKKPFFFSNPADISWNNGPDKDLADQAEEIIKGNIRFFSGKVYELGTEYDWITNPDSGYRYDINKHWSEINDYSSISGDIKYVWEKSRFAYLYTLIRDNHCNKTDHSEFIFSEIDSWIRHNPVNRGPNFRCSQEITLRVFNWIFAVYYYSDSPSLTQERWARINRSVSEQMQHVFTNINFSRIAVRNNHAITETLGLYIVGTLFPWLKNSEVWKRKGKRWFGQEVDYQIYHDGTFLQFSMNYHRVVIQLLNWAIAISDANNEELPQGVYDKAYKSLQFLYQCQEDSNGLLPNYGANDGALFFPLNNCMFRDFRPQLNALHQCLCGKPLYPGNDAWSEDSVWLGSEKCRTRFAPLEKKYGTLSFKEGGYYLMRDANTFTFIRCGNHKDRPSQADNLHVDLWVDGKNIFADSGSYKYNTDKDTLNYFMGTASHNTVMLGNENQMLKGSRFIWYYWTQARHAAIREEEDRYIFEGLVSGFRNVDPRIEHKRIVIKLKDKAEWMISDEILHKPSALEMKQIWHLHPDCKPQQVSLYSDDADFIYTNAWFSDKYGEMVKSGQYTFSGKSGTINTKISIR